jgi:hypothetical protein
MTGGEITLLSLQQCVSEVEERVACCRSKVACRMAQRSDDSPTRSQSQSFNVQFIREPSEQRHCTTRTSTTLPRTLFRPWLPTPSQRRTHPVWPSNSASNQTNRSTSKTCQRSFKNPTSSALYTCSSPPSAQYSTLLLSSPAKCAVRRMCFSGTFTRRHRQCEPVKASSSTAEKW